MGFYFYIIEIFGCEDGSAVMWEEVFFLVDVVGVFRGDLLVCVRY